MLARPCSMAQNNMHRAYPKHPSAVSITRGSPRISVDTSAIASKHLPYTQRARASRSKPKLLLFHIRCFRSRCLRDSRVPVWGCSCRAMCTGFSRDRHAPLLSNWGCVSAALCGPSLATHYKDSCKGSALALTLPHLPLGTETITQNNDNVLSAHSHFPSWDRVHCDKLPGSSHVLASPTIQIDLLWEAFHISCCLMWDPKVMPIFPHQVI